MDRLVVLNSMILYIVNFSVVYDGRLSTVLLCFVVFRHLVRAWSELAGLFLRNRLKSSSSLKKDTACTAFRAHTSWYKKPVILLV